MRLSTSPFPFDPTATAVPATGAMPAAASTQSTDSASFGDLLQAESNSSSRTPGGDAGKAAATASGRRPPMATRAAGRTTTPPGDGRVQSLFDAAADVLTETLTSVAAAPDATGVAGEPALGDTAPEGAPRAGKTDATASAEAQAQIAAAARWLSAVSAAAPTSEPPIEDVQITVDGETYAVLPDAQTASTAGNASGKALPPGASVPRAVQAAYAGTDLAGVVPRSESEDAVPATAPEVPPPRADGNAFAGKLASETTGPDADNATNSPAQAVATSREGIGGATPEMAGRSDFTAGVASAATANPSVAGGAGVPIAPPNGTSIPGDQRATGGDQGSRAGSAAAQADAAEGRSDASIEVTITEGTIASGQRPSARGTNEAALSAGEKFAVRTREVAGRESNVKAGGQKQSLASDDQDVADGEPALGTNTAKPKAPMSASASTPAYPTRPNEPSPAPGASLTFEALAKDAASVPDAELTRAAHRAVDSAMAMAEHFSTGAQRGVSLQFTVSGVDLAVRVEMRADGVHTVFRTDSPELRSALAQEWQSVVSAQTPDAAQRLVAPVFTSTPSGSFTSSDSGMAGQRDPANPQRQQSSEASAQRSAFAASPRRAASAVTAPTAVPARPIALSTARHLHTFA